MYNDWLFEGKLPTGETNITASYHGYWIIKFDQADPHVGTAEALHELVRQAHARGMKVFFDIVVNHTGDIISYEEAEQQPYRSKGRLALQGRERQPLQRPGLPVRADLPGARPADQLPLHA